MKQTRFSLLFAILCAALWFGATAVRADDAPAAPPVPAPTPAPEQTAAAPKVHARKEDEPAVNANTAKREGFFARYFGKDKKPDANAANELDVAQARITVLETENTGLREQLAVIDQNWPAIEAALSQGNAADPALQTPVGERVAQITMKTAAAQIQQTGHRATQLPGPGADKPVAPKADTPAATAKLSPLQLIALGREASAQKPPQN